MIDRALFMNMNAAKDVMQSMERVTNNLSNARTTGFKADHYQPAIYRSSAHDATNEEDSSRNRGSVSSFKQGPIENTGRSLDLAINGRGFIAVQNKQGEEAYSRAGNLQITEDGLLTNSKGDLVLGESGLITIPPASSINIDKQGVISVQMLGDNEAQTAEFGRIKLVNPEYSNLQKKNDGLFYLANNEAAPPSRDVELVAESLEGSNVEPVSTLIDLIEISRKFEYQTKLMKSLEENNTVSNRLLDVTA
jgi:flagellar basal-body rod protein FlgF